MRANRAAGRHASPIKSQNVVDSLMTSIFLSALRVLHPLPPRPHIVFPASLTPNIVSLTLLVCK